MATPSPEANIRVLIVSRDRSIADARWAFPAHAEVRIARDGRDAWDQMSDWIPAVVVVDLQAGNSGGFALAKDMGASSRLENVPILILLQRPQDKWLAKQSGARACRTKPVDDAELVDEAMALTTA